MIIAPVRTEAQEKPENGALTVQTLEDFHSAEQTAARKPLSDVDESCRSKLEKYQQTSQAAGNLKGVLAAKQAIEDLDSGRPVSTSGDAEVAKIQNAYKVEHLKVGYACAKTLAKIDQDYLASLKKLVADLTKGGQIEQAVEVQKKVDQLNASLSESDSAGNPAVGSSDVEEWKKKALSEFPDLKNPSSQLSLRVRELKDSKALIPGYFSNPQWTYLLTKEASLSLQQARPATESNSQQPSQPIQERDAAAKERFLTLTDGKRLADQSDPIDAKQWDSLPGKEFTVNADSRRACETGITISQNECYLIISCPTDRWNTSPHRWSSVDFRGHLGVSELAANGMPYMQMCYSLDGGRLIGLVSNCLVDRPGSLLLAPSDREGGGGPGNNTGSIRVKVIRIEK